VCPRKEVVRDVEERWTVSSVFARESKVLGDVMSRSATRCAGLSIAIRAQNARLTDVEQRGLWCRSDERRLPIFPHFRMYARGR
jgi:hypothetical protein